MRKNRRLCVVHISVYSAAYRLFQRLSEHEVPLLCFVRSGRLEFPASALQTQPTYNFSNTMLETCNVILIRNRNTHKTFQYRFSDNFHGIIMQTIYIYIYIFP